MNYVNLSSDDSNSMSLILDNNEQESAPSVLDLMLMAEDELGCSIFEALRFARDNMPK